MLYISKGILLKEKDGRCSVFRCGEERTLTMEESQIWRKGCGRIAEADCVLTLADLEDYGLVSSVENDSEEEIYNLLCGCMFLPSRDANADQPMTAAESILYVWLRDAGIRLTTAELICLCERNVAPEKNLLGESGRQALVAVIYLDGDINEFTLESRYASAECRGWVIPALLSLVRKKILYIG